jgi:hypothetical protein
MKNNAVRVEMRDGGLMDDWIDYADLLLYGALAKHNEGDDRAAIHYFTKSKDMWNDVELYDKPTRQDGYYTTHKLALLLYVSKVLDQPIPFKDRLEKVLWMFQREDGGVRSHYLGNLTSTREANTETACLVILAYNYGSDEAKENIEKAKEKIEEVRREHFWSGQTKYMAGIALEEYNASNERFEQRDFEGTNQHVKSSIELVNIAYAVESDFIYKIKMIFVVLVGLSCAISLIVFGKRRIRRK